MNKAGITQSLVRCLLKSQFPDWADLPVSSGELDGWDNATFRLGDHMSVRLPTDDGYAPQVAKEHKWLPVLADRLPLAIPQPLARGVPGCGYPWAWSIYRWLEGQHATFERVVDLTEFAVGLAAFLAALQAIDATRGPAAGEHSSFRGGPLSVYDTETRTAIEELANAIDSEAATYVWDEALSTTWTGPPVWVHGDVAPSNLLVSHGRLSAVIDFGCSAVGDPACDTVIAWTFLFGSSRETFQERLSLDDDTWARGRGWALWKALITQAEALRRSPEDAQVAGLRFGWRHNARSVIDDLLGEGRR